jgi:hypothetical protein
VCPQQERAHPCNALHACTGKQKIRRAHTQRMTRAQSTKDEGAHIQRNGGEPGAATTM